MRYKVQTTDGKTSHKPVEDKKNPGYETEKQAQGVADKANAEAERLGIRTRYEVAPI